MAKRVTRSRSKPRRSSRYISKPAENRHENRSTPTQGRKRRSADTTMEIIDKLSQQFKKADKSISLKEEKRSGKDVFNSSLGRNTSYRLMSLDTSFTSTPAIDGSRKSLDYYNFDEKDDDVRLRLDLSPIKGVKTPARNSRTKRNQSKSSGKKGSSVKRVSVGSKSSTTKTSSTKRLPERQPASTAKRQRLDTLKAMNDRNARKEVSTPKILSELQQISADKRTSICLSATNSPADSGVFLTPPSLLQVPCSTENTRTTRNQSKNTPSSTENILSCTKAVVPTQKSDKKPRKKRPLKEQNSTSSRTRLPDSPMLSPVQKVTSPSVVLQGALVTSQSELFEDIDYSLYEPSQNSRQPQSKSRSYPVDTSGAEVDIQRVATVQVARDEEEEAVPYKALAIRRSYSSLGYGYFSKSAEKKTKKKSKTKKTRKLSVSQSELFAKQMNQEFDELESFELSMD